MSANIPTPQRAGGLALAAKIPPKRCPRCRASLAGKNWYGYLGHMGLHGYADRYHCGDISKAARRLVHNSLAKYDPAPWNGAYPRYKKAEIFTVEEKTMKTDFSQIRFEPDGHTYFYGDDVELQGVTSRLKLLQPPFDRMGAARRVADREGRTVKDVLTEWDAKGEKGRQLGTTVHEYIREALAGQSQNGNLQLALDPFLSLNTQLPEINAFEEIWRRVKGTVVCDPDHVEWVVGDVELGVAGTVDTVFYSLETQLYHLWDWKTGKFELSNRFARLYPPFEHLDACQFNIYSLQVSLYRLLIERNTDIPMGDSYLVHLSPAGYEVHRAIDLREDLLTWLECNPPF